MRNTDTQRIRTATKFVRSSAGHSESAIRSSVTKTGQLIVLQPSRSALTMPAETFSLSIATEKCTVVWCQHSVTCRRPPSLPYMVGFCAFRTGTGNAMLPENYRAFLGGDRQSKCLSGHRQSTSGWLEDDQLRCLRNGRTKCTLTVSCRRPDKLGCRSNSLCVCVAHTSSYVSAKFCTFRCLVGDVCQRYGSLAHNAVWKPWTSLK